MEIDYAIDTLNRKAAEYRLNELLLISSSKFKRQPNLDTLYEAESLELVAKWLEELKEARGKLKAIEDIAREAFNKPDTLNIDLYRAQALANIYAIFEYNGATLKKDPPEDDNQVTIEEVLDNE